MGTRKNTKLSSTAIADKLDDLKSEYKEDRQEHRAFMAHLMCEAATLTNALKKSEVKRRKLAGTLGTTEKDKLLSRVMRYIMEATSKSRKKIADKRARAAAYLQDVLDVPPSAFAKEIPRRGGVEKLARQAAELRKKERDASISVANMTATKGPSEKQALPAASRSKIKPSASDNDNQLSAPFRMAPSRKQKMDKADVGERFKLVVVKRKNDFEVEKVISLSSHDGRKLG